MYMIEKNIKFKVEDSVQLFLFEDFQSIAMEGDIFTIYMPEQFKMFKEEYLCIHQNSIKLFSKLDSIGIKLKETFHNILDFDLSLEAQEGKKPWLYLNSNDIDLEYLANKTIESLRICLKEKDRESFYIFCEDIIQAIYNISIEGPIDSESVLNRNRLLESLLTHKLSNYGDVELNLHKIIRRRVKEDLERNNCTEKEILHFEIKYSENESGEKEYISSNTSEWFELQELSKKVQFYQVFENNKHVAISNPIAHNPDAKTPVYWSYVLEFSIDNMPMSENKYIKLHMSRRVWMNSNVILKMKKRRKHSMYVFSRDKQVFKYMLRKNKDTVELASKEDQLYLERSAKINSSLLEEILSKPSNFQKPTLNPFIGVPYDAQTFGTRPRKSGVSNMEKLSLIDSLIKSLNLNIIKNVDCIKYDKVGKSELFNQNYVIHCNKDISINVYEQTEGFFEYVIKTIEHFIKKKDKFLSNLTLMDVDENKATFEFIGANQTRLIYLNKRNCFDFCGKIEKEIEVVQRDIKNVIENDLSHGDDSLLQTALIELVNFNEVKGVSENEDPKRLIRLTFLEENILTQFITPINDYTKLSDKDTCRIKNAIGDLLNQVGITKTMPMNSGITTYSYMETSISVPKSITSLYKEENIKNVKIPISILKKENNNSQKYMILGLDNIWISKESLISNLKAYINKTIVDAKRTLGADIGLFRFKEVFDIVEKDTTNCNRKILLWEYGSERRDFNSVYKENILPFKDIATKNGIELLFIKNNGTTPQFVTLEKESKLHKRDIDGTPALDDYKLIATTNKDGYFKFFDIDDKCINVLGLIGDKPSTHKPNRAHSGFEYNSGEQRRRLLLATYIGMHDLDEVAVWIQENRKMNLSYEHMLNHHIHLHELLDLREYIEILEFKYNSFYKEDFTQRSLEDVAAEMSNDLAFKQLEFDLFRIDSVDEYDIPIYITAYKANKL